MKALFLLLVIATFTNFESPEVNDISWKKLDEGLYIGEYYPENKSFIGDSKFTILKVNPEYFDFQLISASEQSCTKKTAAEWSNDKDLVACVNAGMFSFTKEYKNMGLLKNYDYYNNDKYNDNYGALACINPVKDSLPEFNLVDLTCEDFNIVKDEYHSYTQAMRMIDCNQNALGWNKQSRMKSSIVALGMDKDGNALFIFTRSPYSANDFIKIVLESHLNIHSMMYLEGGPEASLYVETSDTTIAKFGSYEVDFNENDDNDGFWPVPNIIGISKKKGQ